MQGNIGLLQIITKDIQENSHKITMASQIYLRPFINYIISKVEKFSTNLRHHWTS